jgi:hypothetical protein
MSRSALLFVIVFSLCVGFFGCNKGGGGGDGGGIGGIDAALVGIYFGNEFELYADDGVYESELDYWPYYHELILYSGGNFNLNYLIDGTELIETDGLWSEQGGNTLNLFPSGVSGCTSIALGYTFDGQDLILFWDHPCGDEYILYEYYTLVGVPATLPPGDGLSRSTTIGD